VAPARTAPPSAAGCWPRLGFLGLAEDTGANAQHGRQTDGRIGPPGAVQALVIRTDEELMIARDTARLIAGRS
jgi:acetate kinase